MLNLKLLDWMERELSVKPVDEDKLGGNGLVLRRGAAALGFAHKPTHRGAAEDVDYIEPGDSLKRFPGCHAMALKKPAHSCRVRIASANASSDCLASLGGKTSSWRRASATCESATVMA